MITDEVAAISAYILDSIYNGVIAINKEEQIIVINQAAAEMLNVEKEGAHFRGIRRWKRTIC